MTTEQTKAINAAHKAAAAQHLTMRYGGKLPDGTLVYTVFNARRPGPHLVLRFAANGTWQNERVHDKRGSDHDRTAGNETASVL